ncbi:MAG: hypothetical protein ABR969_05425 [Sedimentisphaerales bacterium]|jgi:hypothetical protein
MKKCLGVIILLTAVFVSTGFSASLATWEGAPADANHPGNIAGIGKWTNPYWKPELPAPPGIPGEIKISKPKTVCTVDSNVGNYVFKLTITGGTDAATAPKLEIAKGANLGLGEFRVGGGGAASTGGAGRVNQTGGTLNLGNKLIIGRYGTSQNNPNAATGFYTISGGTITYLPTNPDPTIYIGAAGAAEGTLTVAGKGANISIKKLYVGGDGKKSGGTGTLEFKIDANGVSPIKVEDGVFIDSSGEATTAKLTVSATAVPPKGDILLVETTGSTPITGVFDTVNEKPATEGAEVVLNSAGINYFYKLTYKGGMGANDIMLKFDHSAPGAAPAAPAAKPAAPAAPAAPAPAKPVAPAAPAAPVKPAAPAPAAPATPAPAKAEPNKAK